MHILIAALLLQATIWYSQAQNAQEATAADFFVAANGSNAWSGRFAQANPAGTDGPFATLPRARDAVRELKKRSSKKDLVVRIRGGLYRLKETLVFSLEDSAPGGGTITYAAYGKETPILSSGVPVRNWRKLQENPRRIARCGREPVVGSRSAAGSGPMLTFYEGLERLPRARGAGFAPVENRGRQPIPTNWCSQPERYATGRICAKASCWSSPPPIMK